jgi:hypothetical protein
MKNMSIMLLRPVEWDIFSPICFAGVSAEVNGHEDKWHSSKNKNAFVKFPCHISPPILT